MKRLVRPGAALVHFFVLGRFAGPVRFCFRHSLARTLQRIAPHFDVNFYLPQIALPYQRKGAARAPLLHYLLLGRFLELSPLPEFDARYYRMQTPEVRHGENPFAHYLRDGRGRSLPANWLAARPPPPAAVVPRPAALLLDHARGGGSTRYLDFYERELRRRGYSTLRLRRAGKAPVFVLDAGQREDGAARWFDALADEPALAEFARNAGVRAIVVNHMIDLPATAFAWVPRLAAAVGAHYELLLHDYYYLCPRVNLVNRQGRYCGLPAECGACIEDSAAAASGYTSEAWRQQSHRLLAGAARVVAPSEDLAERMRPQFAGIPIEVLEPEDDAGWPAQQPPSLRGGEHLHIAVIGSLNVPKGYEVLLRLARTAAARRAPLRFTLIGSSAGDAALRRAGVTVTGRYREGQAGALLDAHRPHLVFLPAIWPETWSFVQSIALARGTPVVAFDHGAIAQRLRRLGCGTLLPPKLADAPEVLLDQFLAFHSRAIRDAA